ncbi:MAG: hypothetical protein RRB22_05735 [Gammaproteobacteria bacterium]|nr:hypothetical protein [Gammaproteobacteria bacterium]
MKAYAIRLNNGAGAAAIFDSCPVGIDFLFQPRKPGLYAFSGCCG